MLERSRFEHELWELGISGTREIRVGSGEAGHKPVRLTHYHVRKALHPGAGLLSDSDPIVMNPSQMQPGFVDAADPRHMNLQMELTKLINSKYPSAISSGRVLRIALVDLTGAKYHTPIFAGYGENDSIYGGSLPKILALYAIFQLRFDLNTFARFNGITKGSELEKSILKEWSNAGLVSALAPKLRTLFQFKEKAGSTVEVELLNKTFAINNNQFARKLILAVGFNYIGSVALQSGLFDEKKLRGLWLRSAYDKPTIPWSKSPIVTKTVHDVTALSAASYFVLLAQGRLVNQITSNEIADALKQQVCFDRGLLDGIKTLPGAPSMEDSNNIPPNKCGLYDPYFHDAIHMVRQLTDAKRIEYVVVVLSKVPRPWLDTKRIPFPFSFIELGKDLDALIAAQNPP